MPKNTSFRAQHLRPDNFATLISETADAQSQARRIIDAARQEAERIVAQAEAAEAEHRHRIEEVSSERLQDFIEEDALERHADVFVKLLVAIRDIRDEHEALTPWLTTLVDTALRRIIGDIPVPETIAGIVGEGVQDLGATYQMTLYAHADAFEDVEAARAAYPRQFETVQRIVPAQDLPHGTIRLSCEAGSTEVSVEARLSRVLTAMKHACVAHDDNKQVRE